jgi:hypothetical protein
MIANPGGLASGGESIAGDMLLKKRKRANPAEIFRTFKESLIYDWNGT